MRLVVEIMLSAPTRPNPRPRHYDCAATNFVDRDGLGLLARVMQSGKVKRIASRSNQSGDLRLQVLQMTLHHFRGGDRHGGIEKDLSRFRQPGLGDTLTNEINQLLR